ncbi:spore coat associated protein CotJA [Schnuerera sp. xch1]|uniref:spore coat associated protein CotJA n=1 Tax=Schnuerera sp. xch1 TaxID=2874283 RepID=UPI001CBAD2E6|nr:spore coat associated protein CotJA [Schnuerera sp. xch1]MBZ2176063.1 spore coat associated protein CotJA [Schnuerera sp. xch1]
MNRNYRDMRLARAYVPFQRLNEVYDPKEALKRGTLFPELYMPYKRETMAETNGGGYYG